MCLFKKLKDQTYKNFYLLIVYKKWPKDREVLSKIKEEKGINFFILKQTSGFIEEALNIIYRKADGDIIITTDADAKPSRNWIKEHVELYKKYQKIGVATGVVDENYFSNGKKISFFKKLVNNNKWRIENYGFIDKPIDKNFKDFSAYVGKSGMLVDTGKRKNMVKTFKQRGVNMSWRYDALNGFKLPGYTKQGNRYEAAAAFEAIKRKFIPVWFNGAVVFHPIHISLSRGESIKSFPTVVTAENVLFSYYVEKFTDYSIDLNTLKLRNKLERFISMFISKTAYLGYKIGYELTTKAITENWKPKKVRKELINALKKVGS